MKAFFNLNKVKFKFIGKLMFVGFGIFFSILYFVPQDNKPGIIEFIVIDLSLTFGAAVLSTGTIFIVGYYSYWKQLKLFGESPLIAIFEKYHFQTDMIFADSLFYENVGLKLTQEIKIGYIGPYHVAIFRFPEKSNHIKTAIGLDWSPTEDAYSRELEFRFKKENMTLEEGGIYQTMKVTDNIEAQIIRMVDLLESEKIRPVSLNA